MIVDCHSHFWTSEFMEPAWVDQMGRIKENTPTGARLDVSLETYNAGQLGANASIIFGMRASASGLMVPNDDVAKFVAMVGPSAIGFMSVDPREANALEEMERSAQDLDLRGVKVGPLYQGTSPLDPRMMRIFAQASALGLPVLLHQGAVFVTSGRLADANPILLDDVALAFPELKIIVAHMGHPWVAETAVVMRRHPNVFADIAAMYHRPSILMRALAAAKEYGVLQKVLFGTDFPIGTVEKTISQVTSIAARLEQFLPGTITPQDLHDLFHRPTFALIGLDFPDDNYRT
jgi:predicted TIM-barrel fold metal-dependent hydrolase